ncbi:phage polarity suppression protein [Enterobacter hormaechei]
MRPDAASRDDNREKFTPAQNLNYTTAVQNWPCSSPLKKSPEKSRHFYV